LSNDWTIVLAGDADADERNVDKLLDDWLPTDAEVKAWLPEKLGRSQKGLKKTLTWLEDQAIIPSRWEAGQDPVEHLTRARDAGHDVYLVLLWGDDGDDTARELFEKAHVAGIPVKDLSGALDDLRYEEDEAPPAQLQAEPEKPARRRRGSASTPAADKPAEASTEPSEPEADEAQATIPPRMSAPAKAVATAERKFTLDDMARAFAEGLETASLDGIVRRIVREELDRRAAADEITRLGEEIEASEPAEPTSAYLLSEDGRYRVKTTRTRAKKDETEVKLTTVEADELREAGLLA
jgi:hypothetical protein